MTTTRVAGTLIFSAVLLGAPSLALAQGDGMAGISGMDMGHKIVIPKDALYTKADVEFMQGMIAHHAQASSCRGWRSPWRQSQVLKLSNKIDQSQVPEIASCRTGCPATTSTCPTRGRGTPCTWRACSRRTAQELDAAQGVEFDREYLRLMIQHHAGAIKMVDDLFATRSPARKWTSTCSPTMSSRRRPSRSASC